MQDDSAADIERWARTNAESQQGAITSQQICDEFALIDHFSFK